jgi:hypothetical protein
VSLWRRLKHLCFIIITSFVHVHFYFWIRFRSAERNILYRWPTVNILQLSFLSVKLHKGLAGYTEFVSQSPNKAVNLFRM